MPVRRIVVDQLCLHQWEGATVWAVSSIAQFGEIEILDVNVIFQLL